MGSKAQAHRLSTRLLTIRILKHKWQSQIILYCTVGIIMYDCIIVVQHITSISYHTNTGNILCIAPDDLFDLWPLFLLSP